MKLIFYLFIIFFEYCAFYELIPITNFEKKFIILTPTKDFIILKYYISGSSNLTTSYHQMRQYHIDTIEGLDIYQYKDVSQIKQNDKGEFINYDKEYTMSFFSGRDFISLTDSFYYNKTYFFVVKSRYKLDENENVNFTLGICSTEVFGSISNFIQANITVSHGQILNYKFHIPLEHKKYILYENRGKMNANITIIDNNKKIIHENTSFYGSS